jgi:hypothetical protein
LKRAVLVAVAGAGIVKSARRGFADRHVIVMRGQSVGTERHDDVGAQLP